MIIKSNEELSALLDELLNEKNSEWWSEFYKTRGENIPFYCDKPDENLVEFSDKYKIKPQKALDIGCGIGRNTNYLSQISNSATGIDISEKAITEAQSRCTNTENLEFCQQSIFDHLPSDYDFIYDSGCLHHMPPHYRFDYLELVHSKLTDDGYFSLVCFNENPGEGMTDLEVYEKRTMNGGMLYSEGKLTAILEPYFDILEFREMREEDGTALFGLSINWAILMKKKI